MYIGCMPSLRLRERDRAFFALVSRAVFSNPFSAERDEIDRRIAETYGAPEGGPDLSRVLKLLGDRLRALDVHGDRGVAAYADPDRPVVEHAVLFQVFHRHAPDLDALIERQIALG